MPLELQHIAPALVPLDASEITPSRIAGLTAGDVAKLSLSVGNRRELVGEHFVVKGSTADGEVRFTGDLSGVHGLGHRLAGGRIVIDGPAGRHLGAQMTAGEIIVRGNVSDFAGAEMVGGMLRIEGNSGNWTGAAYPGSRIGMRGGMLVVFGSSGIETGRSMRRGLIVVGNDCGDLPACDMIAGTLLIGGRCGRYPGAGMRRGSIVVAHVDRPRMLPTFRRACRYRPEWLVAMGRQVPEWPQPIGESLQREFELYSGDLLVGGKGEIMLSTS
jgi:formylmethanofuran dehydrogenase subunit C